MRQIREISNKNMKTLSRVVVSSFFVFLGLVLILLIVKVDFYTKTWGTAVNSAEIFIVNKYEGKLSQIDVQSGARVKMDQILARVAGPKGVENITAPESGEFSVIGGVDLLKGSSMTENQIFGIIQRKGSFFQAMVGEKDILDIKEGEKCTFRLSAFENENYAPIHGKVFCVCEIPNVVDYKNYYPVYCVFDGSNPMEKKINIGMSGNVEILIGNETIFNLLMGNKGRKK